MAGQTSHLLTRANTVRKLGLVNVARVAEFRLKKRSGYFAHSHPIRLFQHSHDLFRPEAFEANVKVEAGVRREILGAADAILNGEIEWYGWHRTEIGFPFDWNKTPFTGKSFRQTEDHWSQIPEPNPIGDIKDIWEQSRFQWVVTLAQAARLSDDHRYVDGLNENIASWKAANPINAGAQWMCAQESSIRLLNTLAAFRLLHTTADRKKVSPALLEFVREHLVRIRDEVSYVVAQNNNHGTSVAAAMAVGGYFLQVMSGDSMLSEEGRLYHLKGIRLLEDRCNRLIFTDGGFSQYSLTYHRLLMDTLSQVLEWSHILEAPRLRTASVVQGGKRALNWLVNLVEPGSGDGPNLGANDGTNPFRLMVGSDYRDFRPSIARGANALGYVPPASTHSAVEELKRWLPEIATVSEPCPGYVGDFLAPDFGICRVSSPAGKLTAYLRGANFEFRPSQSDTAHVDLWHNGRPVLTDNGSYRYTKLTEDRVPDLAVAQHHNTILPNDVDPMPRLGRFLFGCWTSGRLNLVESGHCRFTGGNQVGTQHTRIVQLPDDATCVVTDELVGSTANVVLRWHLVGEWQRVSDTVVASDQFELTIDAEEAICDMSLLEAPHSSHYGKVDMITVLKAEISGKQGEPLRCKTRLLVRR